MARPKDEVRMKFENILKMANAHEKFRNILGQYKKEENFLKAYEMACDRAYGRCQNFVDIVTEDVTNRPTTEALIETIRALREELGASREGIAVEAGERKDPVL